MNRQAALLSALLLAVVSIFFTSESQAQATRTWVSGVGDDANPCSRTAPCKTFAGAISKTAASGLISVLDPGGFGAVTITKSITIDGGGVIGSILASSTNGVIINGANVRVVLRNLDIEGAPVTSPGIIGVRFLQGAALNLENVSIRNFTNGATSAGISFQPSGAASLTLNNVSIINSSSAVGGQGMLIKPTGAGTRKVIIHNTTVDNNARGMLIDGTGNTGTIFAAIADSSVSSNGRGIHVVTPASGGSNVRLTIDNVTLANNDVQGVLVAGATAQVLVGGSTITNNGVGVQVTDGELQSFKNNQIGGNTSNGTPITAVPGGPLN